MAVKVNQGSGNNRFGLDVGGWPRRIVASPCGGSYIAAVLARIKISLSRETTKTAHGGRRCSPPRFDRDNQGGHALRAPVRMAQRWRYAGPKNAEYGACGFDTLQGAHTACTSSCCDAGCQTHYRQVMADLLHVVIRMSSMQTSQTWSTPPFQS